MFYDDPTNCAFHIKRDILPTLRTATKEPLPLDGLILVHLSIGNIKTRVWSRIVALLAVEMLLDTEFIYRFIGGIFPLEQKVEPAHFKPVAITAKPRTLSIAQKSNLIADEPVSAAYYNETENASV